ncbi:amphi-Trp domain-containing protein [Haloarchaeobius sp. TZWWS8]|uniref:amphi-Trp domain-containing protein n=1 Tax=Haloarchaeobius sp. TZWWS8 TaxID=3446121 RepID=UPI003EBE105F
MGEIAMHAELSRMNVSDFFRDLADRLERTGPVALELDGDRAGADPTGDIQFSITGNADWEPGSAAATHRLVFELEWAVPATTEQEAGFPEPAPKRTVEKD